MGVGAEGQQLVVGLSRGAGEAILRGPLKVSLGRDRWSVADATGRENPVQGVEPLDIGTRLGPEEPDLALCDRTYPGSFRFVARSDIEPGAFDIVNLVLMEDYLPGVVAGELFDHWQLQTRAAQAIAARSYAASEHFHYDGRRPYDVSNTAASQVYLGRVPHRDSIKAVAMTRGVVLAGGGLLVPGYYSSCCGGLAASAVDALGPHPANDVAPLRRRRGVDVRVILPDDGNHRAQNYSNELAINTMLRNGIRVYLYPGMSHIKAAVYDGWACFGSANFDKLSLQINEELNLGTSDPDIVSELLERVFIPDFELSEELTTPLPTDWTHRLAEFVSDEVL